MPNRDFHKWLSEKIFGSDGEEIHKWLDSPSKWLGKQHRKVRHDLPTILALGITKGADAAGHALLHILADTSISKAKNKLKNEIDKIVNKSLKNLMKIK